VGTSFSFREVRIKFAPSEDNLIARAFPIPEEAPVIQIN